MRFIEDCDSVVNRFTEVINKIARRKLNEFLNNVAEWRKYVRTKVNKRSYAIISVKRLKKKRKERMIDDTRTII